MAVFTGKVDSIAIVAAKDASSCFSVKHRVSIALQKRPQEFPNNPDDGRVAPRWTLAMQAQPARGTSLFGGGGGLRRAARSRSAAPIAARRV